MGHPRLLALGLALGLGPGACRVHAVPSDASAPEAPPAQSTTVTTPLAGCTTPGRLELSITPEHLSLTCKDGFRECSGTAVLEVRNCIPRTFGIGGIQLRPAPWTHPVFGPSDTIRLEPGDTWQHELTLAETGTYEVGLNPIVIYDAEGPDIEPRQVTLTVDNPAREQAEAACRECNGDWGRHGMLGLEGCNCRNADAGTPCDDGSDCEGSCIQDPSGSGFVCSEFQTLWGCHTYLPDGWSKERHPKNTLLPSRCID